VGIASALYRSLALPLFRKALPFLFFRMDGSAIALLDMVGGQVITGRL
jgi:hypothetical protein